MGSKLLAVYGTLKTGEANHSRFLPGKAPRFRGFVEIPYRMYENSLYPMLVPAPERHSIFVEVFEVDSGELERIDGLEAPYGYGREMVALEPLGENAEIYFHPAPAPEGFRVVGSGKWTSSSESFTSRATE